ncbi:MAG: hypothetical protein ACJ74Q_15050 [Pyrinomonadaceae bacterium]
MSAAATARAKTPRLTPVPGAQAAIVIVPGQYYAQYLDGAAEHIKPISPATAHAILRNEDIDTGWLSPGVVRCAETMKGMMALSYRPPSHAKILLDGRRGKTDELTVPLPGLVMIGLETKYYLWALNTPNFDPGAQLFNTPLPNINSDASICFGANKLPRASGQSMSKVWDLFWASPFSDHSVQGKSLANLNDIRPAIRSLASSRATEYPSADLVRHNHGTTVTRAWDSLVRHGKIY